MSISPQNPITSRPSPSNPNSPDNTGGMGPIEVAQIMDEAQRKALGAWAVKEYRSCKSARIPYENVWRMHLAMYEGKHYLQWMLDKTTGYYIAKKFPAQAPDMNGNTRMIINKLRPIVRTEVAKLTAQKPFAFVVPSSTEDADLSAAKAGEQVWESISSTLGYRAEFERTIFWTSVTGNGFIKTWWDKTKKDGAGDIVVSHLSPFHVFVPDLRVVDIQDQPYVINAFTKSLQWVDKFFKGKAKELGVRAHVRASTEIVSDVALGVRNNSAEPDSVLLIELFAKPGAHDLLPNGGRVVCTSDGIVLSVDKELPYSHGEFPFVHIPHIMSGTFYGTSALADLIPLQQSLNRRRSQIGNNADRMGSLQLLAQKGSVDVKKLTNQTGLIVEYNAGMNPPAPLPMQSLPPFIENEVGRIMSDMEDISGQHQVSRGQAPTGITAGTALNYLQESDDTMLGTTMSSIERAWQSLARQTLELFVQFVDRPRTIAVVGADKPFDAMQLMGADLKGGTDIRMEGGSALPTSRSAKIATIMDLMKNGFLDPSEGLKYLEIGDTSAIYQAIKVDENQASRENIKMRSLDPSTVREIQMQEQMAFQQFQAANADNPEAAMMEQPPTLILPINDFDDHDVHITVHNNYRKSQAYENLPDEIKQQFDAHVQAHVQAVNEAMMQVQELQNQQAMAGMPQDVNADPGMQDMQSGGMGPMPSGQA